MKAQVHCVARRLDGVGPPLETSIPNGYGSRGFRTSALVFRSEGCWEVVGRIGEHELPFVQMMIE